LRGHNEHGKTRARPRGGAGSSEAKEGAHKQKRVHPLPIPCRKMDLSLPAGPFGALECLSHEILEKVAVFLDLDNLKKLSKVSTSYRHLATSVSIQCVQMLFSNYACCLLLMNFFCFQQPVWYSKCLELNPKRTAEAIKNWCEGSRGSFMDLPFRNLWEILNVDRIKLVHVTDSDELRIPDQDLFDPSTDSQVFKTKTIGRSRTNYVCIFRFTNFSALLIVLHFRFACFWTKWFRASTPS
jgi:hypothetical protein